MQDVVGNQVLIKDTGFERFKVEANKIYNDEDINATGFSLRSIYNDANKKYAKGSGGFLYSILYQRFFRDLNDAEKNCSPDLTTDHVICSICAKSCALKLRKKPSGQVVRVDHGLVFNNTTNNEKTVLDIVKPLLGNLDQNGRFQNEKELSEALKSEDWTNMTCIPNLVLRPAQTTLQVEETHKF